MTATHEKKSGFGGPGWYLGNEMSPLGLGVAKGNSKKNRSSFLFFMFIFVLGEVPIKKRRSKSTHSYFENPPMGFEVPKGLFQVVQDFLRSHRLNPAFEQAATRPKRSPLRRSWLTSTFRFSP